MQLIHINLPALRRTITAGIDECFDGSQKNAVRVLKEKSDAFPVSDS
jgi:hypothetical protein